MTKTLIDPTKGEFALLDIIETKHGRRHQRNDGELFKLAEENPWYVLATVFGEQDWGEIDSDLDRRNCRAWNGWACAAMDSDLRQELADRWNVDSSELEPFSKEEEKEVLLHFRLRMGETANLPDITEPIEFTCLAFLKPLWLQRRYFAQDFFAPSCHFIHPVTFELSYFSKWGYFRGCHFEGYFDFQQCFVEGAVDFNACNFDAFTYFNLCHFVGHATFRYCNFDKIAEFNGCRFEDDSGFSLSNFKNVTSFKNTQFCTHVPDFHGVHFYDGTIFEISEPASKHWPPVSGDGVMIADLQKQAYSRLRTFMNKNLEIEQELFFHRREMACKEVTEDAFVGWLIWAYGRLSGYGNSIALPLMGLFTIWFVGYLCLQFNFTSDPKVGVLGDHWSAIGISFSNTFAIFGFGETLLSKFSEDAPKWIKAVSGIQAVSGFIFLFLLGLGIRSRFRLR